MNITEEEKKVLTEILVCEGWTPPEKPKGKVWKPEDGEKYWVIECYGETHHSYWGNDNIDNGRLAMGNVYPTKEAAELARDRQLAKVRVINALREYEGDWEADWDDNSQRKHKAVVDWPAKDVRINNNNAYVSVETELYSSEEAWERVIEEMEADVWLVLTGERRDGI